MWNKCAHTIFVCIRSAACAQQPQKPEHEMFLSAQCGDVYSASIGSDLRLRTSLFSGRESGRAADDNGVASRFKRGRQFFGFVVDSKQRRERWQQARSHAGSICFRHGQSHDNRRVLVSVGKLFGASQKRKRSDADASQRSYPSTCFMSIIERAKECAARISSSAKLAGNALVAFVSSDAAFVDDADTSADSRGSRVSYALVCTLAIACVLAAS